MTTRISRGAAACALLATTALCLPAVALAASPAPKFIDGVDDHGVDLVTGLPDFTMEEGGIGSGPGRVAVRRTWAEAAGWADNWTGGLYQVSSGGVTRKYIQFAGISDSFSSSGSSWISDKGDGATLTTDASGYWYYTARDGTQIKFDVAKTDIGNGTNTAMACPGADPTSCQVPLLITAPTGMKFTLTWRSAIKCVPVGGDPCGSSLTYQRLTSVTSSAGYSVSFAYPTGATAGSAQWYQRTSATFSNSANPPSPAPIISYAYPTSTEVDVTDPASRVWKFMMDASGRLTGIQRPGSSSNNISFGYGTDGTVNSATKDGVTNGYGRSVAGTTATETVTDPLTKQTVLVADLNVGRPTSMKDPLNRTTAYTYDASARLTRITAPEGNYVQYGYDTRGNATSTTNVAKSGSGLSNVVTSASFDTSCANVVKCNKPNSTTDAKGNVTNYSYDATHGGVVTVTQPAPTTGAVQPQLRYSYTQVTSASGDLVYMLTGASACQTTASCTGGADETKQTIAYNSNLLPTSLTRASGDGSLSASSTITYDSHGNVSTVDGPLSGTADTTKYRYDAADQVVGLTSPDPDGAGSLVPRAVRLTYRSDGQVSKEEFGTVTDQSDAAWSSFAPSQTIDIAFDSNSRPITSKLSAGGTAYSLTQTSYDALGRVDCTAMRMNTAVYGSLPASACSLSTTGSYGPDQIQQSVYDDAGEVIQLKEGVGTADAATERTLTYSNNGQVGSLKDAENNLTTYVWDGFDRLSQIQYPNSTKGSGTSNTSNKEQFGYDANSNLTSYTARSGGVINYGYDNLNRQIFLGSSLLADRSYTYDLLGRQLTATFTSGGQGVTNQYDALGRVTSSSSNVGGTAHAMSYQYDLAGRRSRLTWWDGFYVNYDRLVTGELSAVRTSSSTLATFNYDSLGRRTSLTRGNGAVTNYDYDAVSRLHTLTHFPSTASEMKITNTDYSPANQIIQQTRSNDSYAYTGHSTSSTSYGSNGLNQLTSAGSATLTYDTNGNLTSDGTHTYTYDLENKLISSSGGPIGSANLAYDPLNRLDTYNPGTATRFVYDGDEVVAQLDSAGNITRRQVRGDGADEILAEYNTSDLRYFHADERGSTIAWTDPSGTVASVSRYDEFGIPNSSNPGFFQYTGQMWLPEAGVYNYKARAYLPQFGEFAQRDPKGPSDSPNLYSYVLANPVSNIDPTGLSVVVQPPIEVVWINPDRFDGVISFSLDRDLSRQGDVGGGGAQDVDEVVVTHPGCPHGSFVNGVCTAKSSTLPPSAQLCSAESSALYVLDFVGTSADIAALGAAGAAAITSPAPPVAAGFAVFGATMKAISLGAGGAATVINLWNHNWASAATSATATAAGGFGAYGLRALGRLYKQPIKEFAAATSETVASQAIARGGC